MMHESAMNKGTNEARMRYGKSMKHSPSHTGGRDTHPVTPMSSKLLNHNSESRYRYHAAMSNTTSETAFASPSCISNIPTMTELRNAKKPLWKEKDSPLSVRIAYSQVVARSQRSASIKKPNNCLVVGSNVPVTVKRPENLKHISSRIVHSPEGPLFHRGRRSESKINGIVATQTSNTPIRASRSLDLSASANARSSIITEPPSYKASTRAHFGHAFSSNSMQHTTLTGVRKFSLSRFHRKKSIEAGRAAFATVCKSNAGTSKRGPMPLATFIPKKKKEGLVHKTSSRQHYYDPFQREHSMCNIKESFGGGFVWN